MKFYASQMSISTQHWHNTNRFRNNKIFHEHLILHVLLFNKFFPWINYNFLELLFLKSLWPCNEMNREMLKVQIFKFISKISLIPFCWCTSRPNNQQTSTTNCIGKAMKQLPKLKPKPFQTTMHVHTHTPSHKHA